jgi:transcriptional regulator with XRE-family HTH domain
MATKHKVVVKAIQRLKMSGVGQKKTAKLLNISKGTVQRVLQGDTKAGLRVAPKAAAAIKTNQSAMPRPPRAKLSLPPQLRTVDKFVFNKLKGAVALWNLTIVSRQYAVTELELKHYLRGTSPVNATEFALHARKLGFPDTPTCLVPLEQLSNDMAAMNKKEPKP